MRYRRLPTTDAARIRALKQAEAMAEKLEAWELAYPSRYIHPLRNAAVRIEGAKHQQTISTDHLNATSTGNQIKLTKAKLYLSHFIQVLNLAIVREEIPAKSRLFYGVAMDDSRIPDLSTDDLVFEWGKKIIAGEHNRIHSGGVPVMNPTIGKVKVWYDQFKDGYYNLRTAIKTNRRANEKMVEIRQEIDPLIREVWNQIEGRFSHLPDEERRLKCTAYGIVYAERKIEGQLFGDADRGQLNLL